MKILTIIGARPQFVKTAALSRVLRGQNNAQEIIVHTGQHFDENMSRIFFEQMDIPKPDYNLNVSGLPHGAMTGRMLEKIEQVLSAEKPDWTLVYGDTNSTLAGALAAAKLHIPVAHVEAGLRSFNKDMPEEINRVLTDHISNLLFAPTCTAVKNLQKEGISKEKIHLVGDVMLDASIFYASRAQRPDVPADILRFLDNSFVLSTIHRADNTDVPKRLNQIFQALIATSKQIPIIMPLHPRTRKIIMESCQFIDKASQLFFINPVGYLEMIWLLKHCSFVMTDSGGLQKEAYFFKKPCITLRDETEWVELIEAGVNILTGADSKKIKSVVKKITKQRIDFSKNLYGNGEAARMISNTLLLQLKN